MKPRRDHRRGRPNPVLLGDRLILNGTSRPPRIPLTSMLLLAMLAWLAAPIAAAQAPSSITLSVNPTSIAEGAGTTTVTVTATVEGTGTFGTALTLTISVGDSDDAATEGTDYGAVLNFDLTIQAGAQSGSASFRLAPSPGRTRRGQR